MNPIRTILCAAALLGLSSAAEAERLQVLREDTLQIPEWDFARSPGAVLYNSQSWIVSTGKAIYRIDSGEAAAVLLPGKHTSSWRSDCAGGPTACGLFSPTHLFHDSTRHRVVVYDHWCSHLYSFEPGDDGTVCAQRWKRGLKWDNIQSATLSHDRLLFAIDSDKDPEAIAVANADMSGYRRSWPLPEPLNKRYADALDFIRGVIDWNPGDSLIWFAFWGCPKVYRISPAGMVFDSIPITDSRFRESEPRVSRLNTQAVWDRWYQSMTPVSVLRYIEPGYFIVQYRIGDRTRQPSARSTFGSSVWRPDGTPVPIDIPERWQLAGVQAGGVALFIHHEQAGSVVTAARIVP